MNQDELNNTGTQLADNSKGADNNVNGDEPPFLKMRKFKIGSAVLLLILLALSVGLGMSNARLQNEIGEKSEALTSLEEELSDTQSQLDTLSQQYAEANSRIEELSKLEDQQSTIDQLNGQVEDLQTQLGTAQAQTAEAQSQLEAAQAQIAELQSQVETLQKQPSSSQSTGSTTVSGGGKFNIGGSGNKANGSSYAETVYWVDGGEVYHYSRGCPSLARSKNIHSGTIAESGKPRACKNCS